MTTDLPRDAGTLNPRDVFSPECKKLLMGRTHGAGHDF